MLSSVQECATEEVEVCVSDALGAAKRTGKAIFYAEDLLSDSPWAGAQVLYRAVRDLMQPRIVSESDEARHTWRIDRVFYTGESLPTGEYDRSIGHWNGAAQHEAFHVDEGCVLMIVLSPEPGSAPHLVKAEAGSIVFVPPGGWHLTYACDGPSTVTNVYTDEHESRPEANGDGYKAKYSRGQPVPLGLRTSQNGPVLFGCLSELPRIIRQVALPQENLDRLPAFTDLFACDSPDYHFAQLEKASEQYASRGYARSLAATWSS